MKIKLLVVFLLISSVVISQEIGSISEGNHFMKLRKTNNLFSLVYSEVKSGSLYSENSFYFNNRETLYSILMDGFTTKSDHQVILQTSNDTIVKLNFKKINGELMLYVYQNNLKSNTFGMSTFFSKKQIASLFSTI